MLFSSLFPIRKSLVSDQIPDKGIPSDYIIFTDHFVLLLKIFAIIYSSIIASATVASLLLCPFTHLPFTHPPCSCLTFSLSCPPPCSSPLSMAIALVPPPLRPPSHPRPHQAQKTPCVSFVSLTLTAHNYFFHSAHNTSRTNSKWIPYLFAGEPFRCG